MRARWLLLALVLCSARSALAVPGPDSTAIAANANDPDSVALADAYRRARNIPRGQMCLLDLPPDVDLSYADYDARFLAPLVDCLNRAHALSRIEAVVLMRGVPLRVAVPIDMNRSERASLAAVLAVWQTTDVNGMPVSGMPPGTDADCGSPCYAARWPNAYRSGNFSAGYTATDRSGNHHHPLLVTMLHGRSYEDAALLLTSALDAEEQGAAQGTFLLMNGADGARGVLDFQYDRVITGLGDRGFNDAMRVPFNGDLTGMTLAAFFTGTAGLGTTIEGNTFLPGAIIDNLTSFGAVPENFAETGEVQVSIARWVTKGVAGAHGTTDEPLNNCFPARDLLLSYVDGYTLAESYFAAMPFVYWRNLVLGDPIAAPYATRPLVTIEGASDGEMITGSRHLIVRASDPKSRGFESVALFVEGSTIAVAEDTDGLETDFTPAPNQDSELLAVAQVSGTGAHSKGWTMITVHGLPEPPDAGLADTGQVDSGQVDSGQTDSGVSADAGAPDSGVEAPAPMMEEDGGCGCRSARASESAAWLVLLAFLALVRLSRGGRSPAGCLPTRRKDHP